MTSLGFLHADVADGGPAARSPMAREAAAAGARFETRCGWEVAVAYADQQAETHACGETVGFADTSHYGTIELQGPLETLGDPKLQIGAGLRSQDAWWCAATPERALVVCDPHVTLGLRERLSASFAGHVLDVTAAYGAFTLVGPLARETFARFCALDLRPTVTPVGAFRPGSVARTPGYVLREGPERYMALFGAAVGCYIWEVVADAAADLGGRPVGFDALADAAQLIEEMHTHA